MSQTMYLTEDLYKYLLSHSLRESEVARRLRREMSKHERASMQIAPDQGQFMAFLVKLINARRTLEIGVFTGYSALVVALALPADGEIIACDVNEEWTSTARQYWRAAGVDHKITLRLAPALETLTDLINNGEEETFDFVFIDSDKENYKRYYECCLRLVRRGGLIAIDNVFWDGKVMDDSIRDEETQAIRRLNQALHQDPRVDISLIPVGDGLTLLRKK
jgi:caffeoyl-CoA O-methyltransferase